MVNRTTILIAHRISTVSLCDNIIVVQKGAIVESGTHLELLSKKGIYASMHERQQLEEEFIGFTAELTAHNQA